MRPFQITQEDGKFLAAWASNPIGSLLFQGLPGRGKTYAAEMAIQHLKRRYDCKFWNMSDLNQKWLAQCQDYSENYELLQYLKEVDVLVFDDMGVRKPSDAFLDFIYPIINTRCDNKSITIYTTNLTSQDMNEIFGSRMVSRIFSSKIIRFNGDDWRLHPPDEKLINLYEKDRKTILNEVL